VQAIGVKMAPTFNRDDLLSVTLKSFRKVVGYDTFESILKESRDEKKDPADYYNVTVSMMLRRNPEAAAAVKNDVFEGGKSLRQVIDKGFPYDDGDISTEEHAWHPHTAAHGPIVGQLNGENITSGSLKNLVVDKTAPVTLAQVSKSDADNLSTLFSENVTRGSLKNLVTDKPAPITVELAQKSDADNLSTLFSENVTRGALKNLVTDRPAPITVALAQIENKRDIHNYYDDGLHWVETTPGDFKITEKEYDDPSK